MLCMEKSSTHHQICSSLLYKSTEFHSHLIAKSLDVPRNGYHKPNGLLQGNKPCDLQWCFQEIIAFLVRIIEKSETKCHGLNVQNNVSTTCNINARFDFHPRLQKLWQQNIEPTPLALMNGASWKRVCSSSSLTGIAPCGHYRYITTKTVTRKY